MLSFDIRSLDAAAIPVDDELAADDAVWEEGDPAPSGPVRVTGRLSAAGAGRVYFSGHVEGVVAGECRRCLTDLVMPVRDDMHVVFAEPGDETADDPDVYVFDPQAAELDLRPAVREQWLLSVPAYAQCRDDCKGLCLTCGADLNAGACECAPASADRRWDALRKVQSENQ